MNRLAREAVQIWTRWWRFGSGYRAAARLTKFANEARARKDYLLAANAYEAVLIIRPRNAAIHIQCGHMFKEAGMLAKAKDHYTTASALTPEDADLALQLGHFHKVAGQPEMAVAAYRRALELAPGWVLAAEELDGLRLKGLYGPSAGLDEDDAKAAGSEAADAAGDADHEDVEHLAPEVAPRPSRDLTFTYHESMTIHRIGRSERTGSGTRTTLRGLEALRGICISAEPIIDLHVAIDGRIIHREGPLAGEPLKRERTPGSLRKYSFNVWIDFTPIERGDHDIELGFIGAGQKSRFHRQKIRVADPLSPAEYPESDGVVELSRDDPRPVEEQVNSQPSMVRPARRTLFAAPPRNVLVMRLDQLGDLVVSIPAIRRLRELLPDSRLIGLIAPANRELAATLRLFDEIVLAEFPDDPKERRRIMPLARQEKLRAMLAPYHFDVAIDMCASDGSRPLLALSGAKLRYGIGDHQQGFLSVAFEGSTRDRVNGLERVPHSARMMGLVDWLGVIMTSHADIVPRPELRRDTLRTYGLSETDRFIVLHTGARLVFSRWPHYRELAAMLLERTDLRVVMLADDPAMRPSLPPDLAGSTRFQLIDRQLAFDEFDALLSFAAVFVGNDSGPKHLAALRGTNVISIHCARHNWNEWGQENNGFIISRRVPCAGCSIHHDPEECGKGFACVTGITAEEVFAVVARLL